MSDLSKEEVAALRRVHAIVAKAPGMFVIVGGWAGHLLRRHSLARPPSFEPLRTEDLDVAAPERMTQSGHVLGETLREQGFMPEYRSEDKPPVTRYLLKTATGSSWSSLLRCEVVNVGATAGLMRRRSFRA
jgi:hypothetical protein